jgi:hypothetical protein
MSYPYGGAEPDFAKARDLDDLESKVDNLQRDVDRRVDAVESQNTILQGSVDELSSDLGRQTRATAGLRREVELLQRRMHRQTAWLQRAAVVQPDAVATDLDAVDDEIKQWAEALRKGNAISAQLLSEASRSGHEATLARYDVWLQKSKDLDAAQIAGARALAAAPDVPADTDWASFNSRKANADTHRTVGRYARQQAEEAKASLDADDAQRTGFQPQIDAHIAAQRALHNTVVGRLDPILRKRLVGPLWFTLALGDSPDGEELRAWLDAAVSLVRYRIIYGVTDPIDALGKPKYPSKVQEQRREVNAKAIAEYQ